MSATEPKTKLRFIRYPAQDSSRSWGRENQKGNVKAVHCQCPITDKKLQTKREKIHDTVEPLVFVSLDCFFVLIECILLLLKSYSPYDKDVNGITSIPTWFYHCFFNWCILSNAL